MLGIGEEHLPFYGWESNCAIPIAGFAGIIPIAEFAVVVFCCCCCFDHLLVQLRGNVTAATCSSGMVVVHGQRAEDSFGGFFSFDEDAARYYNPSCFGVIICIVVHCNSSFTSFFFQYKLLGINWCK